MFRAPLCPSSGAWEYCTEDSCLWYLVLWFSSCRYGVEQRVMKTKAPNTTGSYFLYNTLKLLMMGIMVPETCWASNKICNKNHLLHLVGILFPHINSNIYLQWSLYAGSQYRFMVGKINCISDTIFWNMVYKFLSGISTWN